MEHILTSFSVGVKCVEFGRQISHPESYPRTDGDQERYLQKYRADLTYENLTPFY